MALRIFAEAVPQEREGLSLIVIPALRLPAKAGAQDKLAYGEAGIHKLYDANNLKLNNLKL